jgi:hypothetical protein
VTDITRPSAEQMLAHALRWLLNVRDQAGQDVYLDAMPNNGLGVAAMLARLDELNERDELQPGSPRWMTHFQEGGYEGVTCDWGHCPELAVTLRNTYEPEHGWLPVCERHRLATERAAREASWSPPTPA